VEIALSYCLTDCIERPEKSVPFALGLRCLARELDRGDRRKRPKRFHDELFSSWLWRAAIAAGAPPDRFACDAIGASSGDPDIDVSDAALHRLALASGQPVAHLAAGTLCVCRDRTPVSRAAAVQEALLRHGGLLLARQGRSGRSPGGTNRSI
jgi:hypothetical protein